MSSAGAREHSDARGGFVDVTEVAGDQVSREQVERLCRRYYWAAAHCKKRDVLEIACGSGQGLGYIASNAGSLVAGDVSEPLLITARRHYGERISLARFDAQVLPFPRGRFDAVLLFEALYYIQDAEQFIGEVRRVLRPQGTLLIATANKDLYDFTPSPYSVTYRGVVELNELLSAHGFQCEFFGDTPVADVSAWQRVLRPAKKIVVASGLMPRSMAGKKLLKRLVFGNLVPMPAEITANMVPLRQPSALTPNLPDRAHKVIFCAATLRA